MTYHPHSYVFIKIQAYGAQIPIVKLFGSWSGGYLSDDSWRLNSGVMSFEETENEYLITGYSGTQYSLIKESYPLSGYNQAVLDEMLLELNSYGHKAEIISIEEVKEIYENAV